MAIPEVRGNCVVATYRFIHTNYRDEALARILERIPPEITRVGTTAGETTWYPASYFSAPLRAIADDHSDDLATAQARVTGAGREIATASIAGFMRLLIRFMKPRLFAAKLPEFFSRDFRNTRAHLVVGTQDLASRVLHCHFREMKELPYVACAAQGWLYKGLESMGCKDVRCEGLDPDWSADDGTFHVSWSA